jgi:hypothetical protein
VCQSVIFPQSFICRGVGCGRGTDVAGGKLLGPGLANADVVVKPRQGHLAASAGTRESFVVSQRGVGLAL